MRQPSLEILLFCNNNLSLSSPLNNFKFQNVTPMHSTVFQRKLARRKVAEATAVAECTEAAPIRRYNMAGWTGRKPKEAEGLLKVMVFPASSQVS